MTDFDTVASIDEDEELCPDCGIRLGDHCGECMDCKRLLADHCESCDDCGCEGGETGQCEDACSNCGEADCEGWCDDCEEYACDGCTCNEWNEE